MQSILIIGSTTIDEIHFQSRIETKPGGVPVYGGLTWLKQDIDPVIVSNISEEDVSLLKFFDSHGMTLKRGRTDQTTRFINIYQDDSREQSVTALAAPIQKTLIQDALNLAQHVHFGPLHPEDIDPETYCLDFPDKIITCDIQGLTRSVSGQQVKQAVSPYLTDLLKRAHIVKADDMELEAALDFINMDVFACLKEFNIHEIVMTRADAGGIVYQEKQEIPYAAHPKQRIADTTGAGDVFFAAYLYARIYQHQSVSTASQYAAGIAASHIEGDYLNDLLENQTLVSE